MTTTIRLTAYTAIEYAEMHDGATLSKYNDPIEGAREGITVDEARRVATEDPTLIYLDATPAEDDAVYGGATEEDYDEGRIAAVEGDTVTITWSTLVQTKLGLEQLAWDGERSAWRA